MNKITNVLLAYMLFLSIGTFAGKPFRFYAASDTGIQYTGRIDFSNPLLPRFWSPGVYIQARFKGSYCDFILNDEMLYGNSHNYIEVVLDNVLYRIKLTGRRDTIHVNTHLSAGEHTILICKNTESGIGYLEFAGLRCMQLLKPASRPLRTIEFIGNSITCGAGSDLSEIPCDKGVWYDRHNAYLAYGPVTARTLKAQWLLSSVSGIGLIHSCCDMKITMPEVFDKVNLHGNKKSWDFKQYQPDVVTICLGQNDGIQDSAAFCGTYVKFIGHIRSEYPRATIICLNSPMGDSSLTAVLQHYLISIVGYLNDHGDNEVHRYFFSKRYHNGCGDHPDLKEHEQIAGELAAYIKDLKHW